MPYLEHKLSNDSLMDLTQHAQLYFVILSCIEVYRTCLLQLSIDIFVTSHSDIIPTAS